MAGSTDPVSARPLRSDNSWRKFDVSTLCAARRRDTRAGTALGISEAEVVRNVMLCETEDGEFTTTADVADAAMFFAAAKTNALTGQSLVVSHGWCME